MDRKSDEAIKRRSDEGLNPLVASSFFAFAFPCVASSLRRFDSFLSQLLVILLQRLTPRRRKVAFHRVVDFVLELGADGGGGVLLDMDFAAEKQVGGVQRVERDVAAAEGVDVAIGI